MENGSEHLITISINNAIIIGCVNFESRRVVVRLATMLLTGRLGGCSFSDYAPYWVVGGVSV